MCIYTFGRILLFHVILNPNLKMSNINVCFEKTQTAALFAPNTSPSSTWQTAVIWRVPCLIWCLKWLYGARLTLSYKSSAKDCQRPGRTHRSLEGVLASRCTRGMTAQQSCLQRRLLEIAEHKTLDSSSFFTTC